MQRAVKNLTMWELGMMMLAGLGVGEGLRMNEAQRATVYEVVSEVSGVAIDEVKGESRLLEDLGMDSLDFAKLEVELEDGLGTDLEARSLQRVTTVDELLLKLEELVG